MSKGARTVEEIALAVAVLKARDSRRTRELKAIRSDLDAIEKLLADEREAMLRLISDSPLPATNSTPLSSRSWRFRAGSALERARLFFVRLVGR